MAQWWDNLTLLQQILACLAIPSTVILLLQTILMLFGIGDGGADADADGMDIADATEAADADSGFFDLEGLNLFTVRGILAFFAVFGWLGVILLGTSMNKVLAIIISLLAGLLALYLVALILKSMLKLQHSGNLDLKNAIGRKAKVYITIPPALKGEGKVNLTLQERFTEVSAMTEEENALKPGTLVEVVNILDDDTLLVKTVGMEK